MLFNFTTKKVFKCIRHDTAIYCGKDRGPSFGDGGIVAREPFNGYDRCESYANDVCYNIGKDSESRSMLTNLKCLNYGLGIECKFTISELEVWEIIFEK
jgi:hypothetical protein